jgi:hypothetical protein
MKQNPHALSILGLMLVIFGIIDTLMVNVPMGIAILVIGIVTGYVGLNRAKQAKKN